ncbi:uncharacterized protein LOC129233673 [Uloborus diversus]|uniref:uncharacterized protein LOC129233673 n=1 Tax=Uloborus diversus TaxID=327109 RepID=UPI0024095D57|nr:uncharacterized protein LOC129233673 [Uloborus diversus]
MFSKFKKQCSDRQVRRRVNCEFDNEVSYINNDQALWLENQVSYINNDQALGLENQVSYINNDQALGLENQVADTDVPSNNVFIRSYEDLVDENSSDDFVDSSESSDDDFDDELFSVESDEMFLPKLRDWAVDCGKTDGESYNLSTPSDLWGISQLNRHPSSQSLLQNKSCGNRELSLDGKQPPALASSSILSNKDVEGYLKAILRNVISIKNRIKNLEDHNIALEAKINELDCVKRDKTENLPNDLSKLLPLSTFDEFNMLEEKLSDEMTRKQLVSYLQRVGGTGFRQVATLVLKKLFTDALAAKFSFLGQRGKLSFKTSRICSIIFEIATSTNLSGATEEKVTKVVADWLRHANSRDKRKRQNPSVQ